MITFDLFDVERERKRYEKGLCGGIFPFELRMAEIKQDREAIGSVKDKVHFVNPGYEDDFVCRDIRAELFDVMDDYCDDENVYLYVAKGPCSLWIPPEPSVMKYVAEAKLEMFPIDMNLPPRNLANLFALRIINQIEAFETGPVVLGLYRVYNLRAEYFVRYSLFSTDPKDPMNEDWNY